MDGRIDESICIKSMWLPEESILGKALVLGSSQA